MNKNLILGAAVALTCVTGSVVQLPTVEAGSIWWQGTKSQEENAHRLIVKELGGQEPEAYSEKAKEQARVVYHLQERICNANGIEITSDKFTSDRDFRTKIHPIEVIDNYHKGGISVGAGYIYIGVDCFRMSPNSSHFDNMATSMTIAHEIVHGIKGHSQPCFIWESDSHEINAEKGSIELTDKLPEGGWGMYLVDRVNHGNAYPNSNKSIMKSLAKKTNGKITIKAPDELYYNASDGKPYRLVVGSRTTDTEDAYFGGQIAYCIAKDALTLNSIQIMENNLRDVINFDADYLLVCKSDKLPNGYRILAGIGRKGYTVAYKNDVYSDLDTLKDYVRNNSPIGKYEELEKKGIPAGGPFVWRAWLACAVAHDVGKNKK